MNLKKLIGRILYNGIAKHLPDSSLCVNIGQSRLRNMTARLYAPGISIKANIEKGAVFSSKVSVGDYGNIGKNAYVQGKVIIGKYVMMGPECNIWTINHETARTDIPMCQQGNKDEKSVVIEDDVWIGSRVTILPGVHIGKGTVIGAGTVIGTSIPEYSVVVGNPARVVKNRKGKIVKQCD